MILEIFYAFLFSQICLSSPFLDNLRLGKRYDLGPFDKGTQFETKDRSITIEVPPGNFCGNEQLKGVAQRVNPAKTYDVSLNDYLKELRKAGIYQRKVMILANLNNALKSVPNVQCPAQVEQSSNRHLSQLRGGRRAWIVNIIKIMGGAVPATASIGLAVQWRGFIGDNIALLPVFNTVLLFNISFCTPLIVNIIEAIDKALPDQLTSLDEWGALAISMLAHVVRDLSWIAEHTEIKDPQHTLITAGSRKRDEPNCTAFTPGEVEKYLDEVPMFNGGPQIPVRPDSEAQALHNVQHPNACPNHFVEIGTGEVGI